MYQLEIGWYQSHNSMWLVLDFSVIFNYYLRIVVVVVGGGGGSGESGTYTINIHQSKIQPQPLVIRLIISFKHIINLEVFLPSVFLSFILFCFCLFLISLFGTETGINFGTYMLYAFPGMVVCLLITWCWLQFFYIDRW